ncbi:NAD(P)H-binding protein [Streptomyces puniciscabiei]|uniref:NAD(P)H-binding protein n=1 Tax=Streptomyces puniciscabiei TaxID=164348 RepID=UPI00331C41AE
MLTVNPLRHTSGPPSGCRTGPGPGRPRRRACARRAPGRSRSNASGTRACRPPQWNRQADRTRESTGGVGRQILEQAVAAGHEVTAVVRNRAKPAAPVRTVTADPATAAPAFLTSRWRGLTRSSPASVSAPGPRHGSRRRDTQADVAVMKAADARRIALVSSGLIGTGPQSAHPRGDRAS